MVLVWCKQKTSGRAYHLHSMSWDSRSGKIWRQAYVFFANMYVYRYKYTTYMERYIKVIVNNFHGIHPFETNRSKYMILYIIQTKYTLNSYDSMLPSHHPITQFCTQFLWPRFRRRTHIGGFCICPRCAMSAKMSVFHTGHVGPMMRKTHGFLFKAWWCLKQRCKQLCHENCHKLCVFQNHLHFLCIYIII